MVSAVIHHISITVNHPLKVARALGDVLQGSVYGFPPLEGSYIVLPFDAHGTAIEVYPRTATFEPGLADGPQTYGLNASSPPYIGIHAAISVPSTQAEIEAIGDREGWRTLLCDRGPFRVIEFWVENWLMLELLPANLTTDYLAFIQPRQAEAFLGAPIHTMAGGG
jgi:hypothetical protein